MEHRFIGIFRWILYGFFLFFVAIVQRVVLGDFMVWGTTFSLLPVAVAAVACQNNHQDSALFGLCVGLFWSFLGQASGAGYILFLTLGAMVSGWVCTHYLTRGLGATILQGAFCLAICEGGIVLQMLYMNQALPPQFWQLVLIQIGVSTVTAPVFWALSRLVERTVDSWKKS